MPKRSLPDFASPTAERLRDLYRRSDDELVRNTVLEVIRLRELVEQIEGYREAVERCWNTEGHGQLVALYKFRILMRRNVLGWGFSGRVSRRPSHETGCSVARADLTLRRS